MMHKGKDDISSVNCIDAFGIPKVVHSKEIQESYLAERCYIMQIWGVPGDPSLSIARARVEPGVCTAWHMLRSVTEKYLILAGEGSVEVGDMSPTIVGPGSMVHIPQGTKQRIRNIGKSDLLFYCVCTPAFTPEVYQSLES